MLNKILGKFSHDLGIDLGTINTLIYVKDKGIVINEPSVVAINKRTEEVLTVGAKAEKMLGKTPPHIEVIEPLVNGIISDFEASEKMLKYFIDKVNRESFALIPRPKVIVGVPLDTTEVEKKAAEDAIMGVGAREVYLIENIVASGIGARLDVQNADANTIIDIGGGSTEIAVLSLGGVVTFKSLPFAGNELNRSIIQYARDEFNLLLGNKTAEKIKIKLGNAKKLEKTIEMKMQGRDITSGLPKEVIVNDKQIKEAMERTIQLIIENIKATLEMTPPELMADIYKNGIMLTGGGALIRRLDELIAESIDVPVKIADDPLTCTVRGIGMALENPDLLKDIIIPGTQNEI